MKIIEYPVICWKIDEKILYGRLIGVNKQVVADDVKSIKSLFSEYIEKKLKVHDFFEPDIREVKLKSFRFPIRPHYKESERIYPIKETVDIEVQTIYGSNEYGYYECFLPLLGKNFYFYNEQDLEKLTEHFSRDIFHSMSPKEIYELLLPSPPWLEIVQVKMPKQKTKKGGGGVDYSQFKTLVTIGEKLPYSRKETRSVSPDIAWERGNVIDHLITALLEENGNVLLVGKNGVGKSAIIQDAIKKVTTREKSKEKTERHSFWRTTPSRMISKAKYLGEWQMICEDMVADLQRARGILWIENFVMLALTGGHGVEDSVAAFLTSFIRQRKLKIVSEVTPEQLEALRRTIPGFVEHFQIITVEEMDTTTTLRIFDYFNNFTTKSIGVSFSQKALEIAYMLLDRFIRYESFPGKAMHFLHRCANQALLQQKKEVDFLDIMEAFSIQSGIPDFLLRDDLLINEEELTAFFQEKIKGQNHIIDRIASVIKVFKAGLNDPHKPIATMLFAGPTGVGKTATVKAIAAYFFGMGQKYTPLIRLDMSEFQHASQIYRLIGTDGKLIQHVREKPFTVVLLDEIEKANPLIFDALLTVLDEGILLDSAGRMTDFRNTIIIMTSNLGVSQRSSLGFKNYQEHDYESGIRSFFRPEFFNRIDMCLVFNSLNQDTILSITRRELAGIEQRDGFRSRNLKLHFTEQLMDFIGREGFDEKYGARPLQREVERLIVAPLAHLLVENPQLQDKTIRVDYNGAKVLFQ